MLTQTKVLKAKEKFCFTLFFGFLVATFLTGMIYFTSYTALVRDIMFLIFMTFAFLTFLSFLYYQRRYDQYIKCLKRKL
jgi:hypothetical protein